MWYLNNETLQARINELNKAFNSFIKEIKKSGKIGKLVINTFSIFVIPAKPKITLVAIIIAVINWFSHEATLWCLFTCGIIILILWIKQRVDHNRKL